MKKTTLVILTSLTIICLILAVYPFNVASRAIAVKADSSTASDSQPALQSISMPVEYVNYKVSTINGSLWATVDGTFPIDIPLDWVGQGLPMLYPTPPGVTNISIEVDGQKVDYSNFTQANPDALHYTYLGEWPMIMCIIQPASSDFLMTIHYQHPIPLINGTYMFLYDLNISPYLSNSSTQSTAYFSILFTANCTDINVYTVPGDSSIPRGSTRTPVNFIITKETDAQTVAFNITSSYTQPVPGDELITFQNPQNQIPEFPSTISLALIITATLAMAVKCKRGKPKASHAQN